MAISEKLAPKGSDIGRAEELAEKIKGLKTDLADLAGQVQKRIADRADAAKEQAIQAAEDTQDLIRQNPLPAVGIALGVGFIVGLMIPSSRSQGERFWPGSRREFDRLADTLKGAIENGWSRAQRGLDRTNDPALLERLTGILSGLFESSRATASSVASAGEKTARSIADRVTSAVS